jgi:hypothetical protein
MIFEYCTLEMDTFGPALLNLGKSENRGTQLKRQLTPQLKGKIIPDFFFSQFSERGLRPTQIALL